MLDFDSNDTVKSSPYANETAVSNSGALNFLVNGLLSGARWYMWKYIFFVSIVGLLGFFAGGKIDKWKSADEISTHLASDGHVEALKGFIKASGSKSTKLNIHPVYKSEEVKEWEEEHGKKFKKIYKYIQIKNKETGVFEDMLVMKKPAVDIETSEALKLELDTAFTTDAESVCGDYLGDVPTDYQKSFYIGAVNLRIKKIDGEVTQQNDNEAGQFRCVINQESIKDLLDE